MKRYKLISFVPAILTVFLLLIAARLQAEPNDAYYYKVNKSFEIYGAVFRQIAENYVLDIDPEELMEESINGMLGSLDPYTVYMDDSETEDIDMLTSNSYVGLGVTVSSRDSTLTIIDLHDGFPAQKAGIKIGDKLYKIDSTVVLNKSSDDLRKYTRGTAGSKADVWVIRPGVKDTLKYTVQREEIKVNNVSYYGVVGDSVAYIRLDRFGRYSGEEIRSALNELRGRYNIKGVILDLRDNPGGLLEAAVNVAEIFVPENTTIVTTKGRNPEEAKEYKSMVKPLDTQIPLAILINNFSASASEVTAGAMQDLDRAVIIGEKSFGKGLVQTVVDLPYKANLKITTAKYYTPSGRSIQKFDYNEKADHKLVTVRTKDTTFRSTNGRFLVESKGIIPDSTVKEKQHTEFVVDLLKKNLIFNYATDYANKHKSIPENFTVTQEILNDFSNYLKANNFSFKSTIDKKIDTLKTLAEQDKINSKTMKDLLDLETKIRKEEKDPVHKYADDLKSALEPEIYRRYYTEKQTIAYSLTSDNYINTALKLLAPNKYYSILAVASTTKNNEVKR